MKQQTVQAIVLKRINYGEADRILTVLSNTEGMLTLFAKGARRAKSKLSGGLELFSITDITYVDGRSDMKTITSTRLATHFESIVKNVDKTMAAYDFMGLIYTFSQHTEHSDYYAVLSAGLAGLDDTDLALTTVETWFYTSVLRVFGSSLNTESPLNTDKFSESSTYNFSYDDMSFYEHPAGEFGSSHIKYLRLVSRSSTPGQLKTIIGGSELADLLAQTLKTAASMHKA